MDSSIPYAGTVSEDISRESHAYSLTSEKPHIEYNLCTCGCMKETDKSTPPGAPNLSSIRKDGDLIVHEVGSSLGLILHVHENHDSHGDSSGLDATSDQDETADSKEIKMCQEFSQSVSLDEKVEKGLSKCATFPAGVWGRERLSGTTVQGPRPSTLGSPSYGRSVSLPISMKPVSAMKGGRAQKGMIQSPDVEWRVKWAPEVRDPPATSMSHTVRSHHYQQRPKAKKSGNKHKKNKGKSSSRGGSGSTNTHRRSIGISPDPLLNMRLQAAAAGSRLMLVDGYAKSNVEVVYAVSEQEDIKCRGSFLRGEGIAAKVQLSIAEAS